MEHRGQKGCSEMQVCKKDLTAIQKGSLIDYTLQSSSKQEQRGVVLTFLFL